MDGFDKFLNKAKDIANLAVDKTEELIDTGKSKLDIKQAEYDMKKLYQKIGKTVYDEIKNGGAASEKVMELADEVSRLQSKIDKIEKNNQVYDEEGVCPDCGEQIIEGYAFCPKCGKKF